MKKIITEGICTFFLMLSVLMATGVLAPLAVGFLLMAMTYSGMRISGAHYNPAISFIMLLQNKITRDEFPLYVVAQVLGTTLAAAISGFLLTAVAGMDTNMRTNHTMAALVAEFVGAFALAYVFLNVALPKRVLGNMYYGAAIGFTVMALSVMLGEVSGAVFNPAVALGMAISGKIAWGDVWLYLVAAFLGAGGASTVFTLLEAQED
jgi:aquaporin Z